MNDITAVPSASNIAPESPQSGDVSVAGDVQAMHPRWRRVSKYQRWYEELCAKAKGRAIPSCYTEVHHIKPRSLGGSDDESNLVRLTYKEHYTAHHLLTKFHTGIDLAKMQKALWAMTLKASGERLTTAWQFEAAKRAVRDIELNPAVDAAWQARWKKKQETKKLSRQAAYDEVRKLEDTRAAADCVRIFQGIPEEKRVQFFAEIQSMQTKKYPIPEYGAEMRARGKTIEAALRQANLITY